MDVKLSYAHPRTRKARLRRQLAGPPRIGLACSAAILCIVGVGLVVFGLAIGWLIAGLAALPAMVVAWYDGDLAELTPSAAGSINDVLDADVLGRVTQEPTSQELARIVSETSGGYFLAARFGITANFLQHVASDAPESGQVVLADAATLAQNLKAQTVTPPMLAIGIIRQFPAYENLLGHLSLTDADLIEAVRWNLRLHTLIRSHAAPRRSGGIARDWSFGFTPLIARFGRNISQQVAGRGLLTVETAPHQAALDQMLTVFSRGGNQNISLVGPTGTGKTTLVESFAEKLMDGSAKLPGDLKFRQIIMLDASALISAAPGRGELEELVMTVLGEAYAAKNIIVCLDNAQVFFEERVGSVDLSNVLLPVLEAGRLRIILTMDEQRFLEISARNPALANALNRISLAPSDEAETMQVMQDQVIAIEFRHKVTFTYQALKEAYRLSARYVHDIAMPGQALKLLESSTQYASDGLVTIQSVQTAIEQTLDVKVSVASETEDREKLLNMENLIHERMINQTRAVSVVSDALRRARAGVRNQDRPIGTFLFLGPTGVGKTELAKALADVYFGGEDRMIRLDLNEFVRSEDVARLIADGASDPTSLTAQAMKRPYSVVLLDEIEKAHPAVLTTLLQLLDEGILRDINGREISFRDAIIIATSNAGAERIREYIERGYKLDQFEDQLVNQLIDSGEFRPEFLNRFDEIVLFTPLGKAELLKVVDLMIAGVNRTLKQQNIQVDVAPDAKELLVERGYDPRLGARPMRRVIQKTIENTVAKLLLSGSVPPGTIITISREKLEETTSSVDAAQAIASGSDVPPAV